MILKSRFVIGPFWHKPNNPSNAVACREMIFRIRASASAIGCLAGRGAVTTTVLDGCGACPNAADWAETGLQVVSVEYAVAPRGRWPLVTDQIIEAYQALLAEGVAPTSIGMIGDSAGGSIVAGSSEVARSGTAYAWRPRVVVAMVRCHFHGRYLSNLGRRGSDA